MTRRPRDLTSDPAAERLADHAMSEAELKAVDARSGGSADRAPRSLHESALAPDDEQIAAPEGWDEPYPGTDG